MKAFVYLRTSGDDGKNKAGIPVQREGCVALAAQKGFEIEQEFVDDGVTGRLPMHSRPAGKQLISALLGNGIKIVLVYDGNRIGRTMGAFWSFAQMCKDDKISVLDKEGKDLCSNITGGFESIMAAEDRDRTVERFAAGKKYWREKGKRCEGRHPYGQHPRHEYDSEREIVARIERMHANGLPKYQIKKQLNLEGIKTRYGCEWRITTITNILRREKHV